jgi:DNA polymerase III delta prime subunit
LTRQAKSLESICDRLRTDYATQIRTSATRITSSIPRGTSGVAFDAKLWIWWDSLEFNASQLERQIRLSIDGDRLEATYEAIILTDGKAVQPGLYEFEVAATSTEAKFKEDSRLTLGKIGRPGMPLERAARLLPANAPQFQGDQTPLNLPLWSALSATLVSFDRVNRKAEVAISCNIDQSFVPYLLTHSTVDLLNDVFLLETKNPKAFDWSKTSATIFSAVGDPPIAFADPNASKAMGITSSAKKSGSSAITPLARVLWEPHKLQNLSRMLELNAQRVASFAGKEHGLNQSQIAAVKHAAQFALTLIWGPPGTGKTNTLAALIHSLANDAANETRSLKILVTGPTYKAVEEVLERACRFMNRDQQSPASVFMCYSKGRNHGAGPIGLGKHLSYETLEFDDQDQTYARCANLLLNGKSTVIVGAQIRQARRFTRLHQADAAEIFDVVIIDESSQVPVSQSVSALATLKADSRLVVAGDHLQMPPITSIDPPAAAEYMVGSIQTYLTTRKFQTAVEPCVLATNYRSCSDLVSFAKRIGYPQSLEAEWKNRALHTISPLCDKAQYPSSLPWSEKFKVALSPTHPVVTLLHDDEVSSQGNHFEARVVAGLVWMLRQSVSENLDGKDFSGVHQLPSATEFWRKCVGVVTPHRAQRALVIRELEQLFPQEKNLIDEAVDTVERFQGGERHTIIVTFGVADTDVIAGEEAFLMQLERTNVAVSRAMAKCIVVMPSTLAAHIPEDKKALTTAFALKDYIENFCNIRTDATIEDGSSRIRGQLRYHRSTTV